MLSLSIIVRFVPVHFLSKVQVTSMYLLLALCSFLMVIGLSTSKHININVVHDPQQQDCGVCDSVNNNNNNNRCCVTLGKLAHMISNHNSLDISFDTDSLSTFDLTTRLTFENILHLTLRGSSNFATVIRCNKQGEMEAGLTFKNASNVSIVNITFQTCGVLHNSTSIGHDDEPIPFGSALFFDSCTNVQLSSVSVVHSNGIGVTMYDVVGQVVIKHCTFENNAVYDREKSSGGGGLYMEFTPRRITDRGANLQSGHYLITYCTFAHNQAHTARVYPSYDKIRTFGQGGGMHISLRGAASNHIFNISHCNFHNNSAVWGGGFHFMVSDSSQNNTVHVRNSTSTSNRVSAGGGGMVLYMISPNHCKMMNNKIDVTNCLFAENIADNQGGGTIIHSRVGTTSNLYCEESDRNHLTYESCTWSSNFARYSGAVDITTRQTISDSFSIVPVFSNCSFLQNGVIPTTTNIEKMEAESVHLGKATLMLLRSIVRFEKFVTFENNNSTAVYAISSKVEFCANTLADFNGNTGRNGGAITLLSSHMSVGNNVYLNFTKNRAYLKGGAIYSFSVGQHELHQSISDLNCFLQLGDKSHDQLNGNNVTMNFDRNRAQYQRGFYNGQSVFATSLLSCVSIEYKNTSASKFLSKIANFNFVNSSAHSQIATSVSNFSLSERPNTLIIPGKETEIPVSTTDVFNHAIQSSYRVFSKKHTCTAAAIVIDTGYKNLPNHKLKLYGEPGTDCTIYIERDGYNLLYVNLRISLVECPPGYVLLEEELDPSSIYERTKKSCECALYSNGTYRGIDKCNSSTFQASIVRGIWAGYETVNASEDNLITAYCPHSFCSYNSSEYFHSYLLPGVANKTTLDKFMCQKGRTGRICGSCTWGYSAYFHSPGYKCKKDYLCSLGWLFYLLSEVFPLVIIFTVILAFNVNFASGTLNGFLFFAQVIDILSASALNHTEYYLDWTSNITKSSIFIYRFFNLNFFYLDSMSFCLWKGATTLDIIAMKYATIALAFILVVAVFIIMNVCTSKKFKQISQKLALEKSVIHGISTFLVTCLAQTVKVSFHIFTPATVYTKGRTLASYQVLYNGDIDLFRGEHLKYAIPALFGLLSVVVIPTILLLWYPMGFKILERFGLSENKLVKCLEKAMFINRLKPVFDSFQGCYKDNFRFFAGLFFIYRISIFAASSFAWGMTQFYIIVEIQLIIMLMLHSLAQPYKEQIHNTLDSFHFANLAIITGLSIFIHMKGAEQIYLNFANIAGIFQVFLIALPLVCLLLYVAVKVLLHLKVVCFRAKRETESFEEDDIPFRMLDESKQENYSDFVNFDSL